MSSTALTVHDHKQVWPAVVQCVTRPLQLPETFGCQLPTPVRFLQWRSRLIRPSASYTSIHTYYWTLRAAARVAFTPALPLASKPHAETHSSHPDCLAPPGYYGTQ